MGAGFSDSQKALHFIIMSIVNLLQLIYNQFRNILSIILMNQLSSFFELNFPQRNIKIAKTTNMLYNREEKCIYEQNF